MSAKKVVVGMSGGVDSSVAAYLLKQQGYDVIGVTMQIWQDEARETLEENGGCCGLSAVDDARRVAFKLDIPYYVMNFKEDFKKYVIDYFVEEYRRGRTPNPCIACNRHVKWESLLRRSRQIGADYIATGHYAVVEKCPSTGRYALRLSKTQAKDQTYALYNLTQSQLECTLMPVGGYTKDEIRKIAEEIDLGVARKRDSQEICFVPDNDYGGFIEREYGEGRGKGSFVDTEGNVLGWHRGIERYTVGQRKGLGIALGRPMYVQKILPETNEVVLCDNESLFHTRIYADDLNFMSLPEIRGETRLKAKIRYGHRAADCTARITSGGLLECVFDEPQRAVTPGQAVVLYDGDYVACGGRIVSSKM